jgi:hypothetical protein
MQTGRVMVDRIPGGRPVGTYSIVARDDAGALGVAVQSHWFNVGAVVPWVQAGVGAVAVQSISDPSTGECALGLLRSGKRPDVALAAILDADADAAYRQIAIVDANGMWRHTGELCISEAGHRVGDGYSAQRTSWNARRCGRRWPPPSAGPRAIWSIACSTPWTRLNRRVAMPADVNPLPSWCSRQGLGSELRPPGRGFAGTVTGAATARDAAAQLHRAQSRRPV